MKTIEKSALVDGAYYEGFDEMEQPKIARWSATYGMFYVQEHTWEESFVLLVAYYEGESSEYFGQFSPVIRIDKPQYEIAITNKEESAP